MVEIARGHSHPRLFAAVLVISDSRLRAYLLKTLAAEVVVIQVGRRIACYIDVGPAIVVKICDQRSEAIASFCPADMYLAGNVFEISMPIILIERIRFGRQSARSAQNRHALPLALALVPRLRSLLQVKVDIVNHNHVFKTVAVEIQEGAP